MWESESDWRHSSNLGKSRYLGKFVMKLFKAHKDQGILKFYKYIVVIQHSFENFMLIRFDWLQGRKTKKKLYIVRDKNAIIY